MRHRLFAIHVLACCTCVDYDPSMLMVGYGHNHRVDILAVEDLFIITRCRDLLLHGFLCCLVAAVIKITRGNTFNTGHGERRRE